MCCFKVNATTKAYQINKISKFIKINNLDKTKHKILPDSTIMVTNEKNLLKLNIKFVTTTSKALRD